MVTARAIRRLAIVAALLAATLWYLRDPAWIAGQTTGLWDWERDAGGTRYRWANSHASFFVPSNASAVRMGLATTFDEHGRDPLIVTLSVDDVRAARVLIAEDGWHDVEIALPPDGTRRERRIDVRTNGTRADNRAIRIREPELIRSTR